MNLFRIVSTHKPVVSLVGVGVVLVSMAVYITQDVLDIPVFNRPNVIYVDLPASGGLYAGSPVTYRGVKIGRISRVHLTKQGSVEATASITDSRPIPASSVVKVRSLSPVGEQYLDFQPPSPSGPYLVDGSHVRATAADIPKSMASTVISVNKLLGQVDPADLQATLGGLSAGLEGTGDDLQRLADQGYAVLKTLDESWPTITRLLHNGGTVLKVGAQNARNIRTISSSSRLIAAFLRVIDPTFDRLLRTGPQQFERLDATVAAIDAVLPGFLKGAIGLTDILVARDPHFRELLRSYHLGIEALSSAIRDGALRGHVLVSTDYRCDYGATRRDPRDTTRYPLDPDGQCDSPPNRVLRGAKHAPGPLR